MLKTLGHHGAKSNTSMLRLLNSFRDSKQSRHYFYRRSFCSDSSDKPVVESREMIEEWLNELKQARFKISTVLALPLFDRPLFQSNRNLLFVKDPKLLAALEETYKQKKPFAPAFVGAFLLKENGPNINPREYIYEVKGKYTMDQLHEVGALAQIVSIQGDQICIMGCERIRMTEMVEEEPLRVKIDHLKDNLYNEDLIKAKSLEVISTIIDYLNARSYSRDLGTTYKKLLNEMSYANLVDFGAGQSEANISQCQQVIEEMDLYKRLQLTLDIVKKDLENIKKVQ